MGDFTILCLNGGGVRGLLQVGALTVLGIEELYTVFTDGLYGISIGSIICTLIAFKFTMSEILDFAKNLRLDELIEHPRLDHLLNIHTRMGIDTGERVYNFLKSVFHKKGLNIDSLRIGEADVPLYIIASDMTNTKTVIFNESVRVWDAIRASISLPLVFTPHILKGRSFVDGAVLCKSIVKLVPKSERHKMLALLCMSDDGDLSSVSKLMSKVIHSPFIGQAYLAEKKYPKNVCLLKESSTGIIDFNVDCQKLLDTGSSIYRLFLAKRAD